MAKLTGIAQVQVIAEKSKNLDTICYRGSGTASCSCPSWPRYSGSARGLAVCSR